MVTKRNAGVIPVRELRLLYQWPLVLEPGPSLSQAEKDQAFDAQKALLTSDDHWNCIERPIDFPPKEGKLDGGGYGEFVYFHDFAQKFLYPTRNGAFSLFHRRDIAGLNAGFLDDGEHRFSVERLTLHMFKLGVAMMTLELKWQGQSGAAPLMLSQAQRIIDHLRRSYTPFWDKYGVAGRVPRYVELTGAATRFEPPKRDIAEASVLNSDNPDAKIFGHLEKMIAPLQLLAHGGPWRDPSDERIPLNSFIALDPVHEGESLDWKADTRAALQQIRDGDWHRIMDADQPDKDDPYAYNPRFARRVERATYYDRFFPHPDSGSVATRYLFGGVHFSAVGAGSYFVETILPHWRRHYAQLSLIARLEMATLLAVSSRISAAVEVLDQSDDEAAFDKKILDIQRYFLRFVHRFRFTGVTSQLQGAEMYEMWRKTLHLDALFADVKAELEIATAEVIGRQQASEARAANELAQSSRDLAEISARLAKVATLGIIGGLIVGALGMNVLVGEGHLMGRDGLSEPSQFLVVSGVVLLVSAGAARFFLPVAGKGASSDRFSLNLPLVLSVTAVAFVIVGILFF